MMKVDWSPGYDWPVSDLKFESLRFSLHMVKDDWSPPGMTDQYLTQNCKVII